MVRLNKRLDSTKDDMLGTSSDLNFHLCSPHFISIVFCPHANPISLILFYSKLHFPWSIQIAVLIFICFIYFKMSPPWKKQYREFSL